MGRFSMSKTMTAAVTFGLFLLLVIGLAASRCGRGTALVPAVVVVDSVSADSAKTKRQPPAKQRKTNKKKTPSTPARRDYLDEPV